MCASGPRRTKADPSAAALPKLCARTRVQSGRLQLAIPFCAPHATRDGIEVRDVGVATGASAATLHTDDELPSVAFSPDGRPLAGGQVNGEILLWETDRWTRVGAPLPPGGGPVLSVAFSSDGRTLAGSYGEAEVALWDVEVPAGHRLAPGTGWTGCVVHGALYPYGSRLFVLTDYGNAFRWEVDPATCRRDRRASSPAAASPRSSGSRSCPSRTTSRFAPRTDTLDPGLGHNDLVPLAGTKLARVIASWIAPARCLDILRCRHQELAGGGRDRARTGSGRADRRGRLACCAFR